MSRPCARAGSRALYSRRAGPRRSLDSTISRRNDYGCARRSGVRETCLSRLASEQESVREALNITSPTRLLFDMGIGARNMHDYARVPTLLVRYLFKPGIVQPTLTGEYVTVKFNEFR
jgi:hypothetical protein